MRLLIFLVLLCGCPKKNNIKEEQPPPGPCPPGETFYGGKCNPVRD